MQRPRDSESMCQPGATLVRPSTRAETQKCSISEICPLSAAPSQPGSESGLRVGVKVTESRAGADGEGSVRRRGRGRSRPGDRGRGPGPGLFYQV